MGRPLLSVGAGAGDPLGRVPQPRTPSCPYLQGGQQSGQLGELLLEGLVLLLILAGGGAGSLVSQGRAARLPRGPQDGAVPLPPSFAYPSPPASLCPEPPCLPHWPLGCSLPRAGRGLARLSERRLGGRAGTPLTSAQPAAAALSSPPVCPGRDSLLPTGHAQPCRRPALPRSAGPQVHTGSPPSLQARLPEPAACLPASRCLGVPESSPQTPPPGGSPP